MAGAAIVAARILLIMMAGRMIRLRVELRMMLLHGRSTALVRFALLRDSGMTVAGHRLHGDRNSQRIAAEQRQPDGQNHCNKFSNGARHMRSLAKSGDSVKYESAAVQPSDPAALFDALPIRKKFVDYWTFYFTVIALSCARLQQGHAIPMSTFKVLQFNMQFGQIWDDADPDNAPANLELTISEILDQDADIVLLQEVEHAKLGGVQLDPPPNYTRLKAALGGYHGYFSYPKADPRELPFGIGLAIFSKTPLYDAFHCDLPSPPIVFEFKGEEKTPTDRLLIGAKTTLAGHELQLFNTHLLAYFMLNSSSEDHIEQRRLIARQLHCLDGPVLLGGDFNVSNHNSLIQQFAEAGYQTVQTKEITWRRRPYVLDHIFYNRYLHPVRYAVKPTMASDHHMLIAEFEFLAK